jgi:hypothetical protein
MGVGGIVTFKGADVGELNNLSAELARGGAIAAIAGLAAVERSAVNVRTTAQKLAPFGPRTAFYPASITYDVDVELTGIIAEIGPDKDKPQGPLGNIFEYGTSEVAAQAHIGPAVDIESPNFYRAVGAISAKALW